jgi:predicted O-methyltransferase YrrM
LIAVDNPRALAGVPVIEQQTENAAAMRVFNETVRTDERVDLAMLTIGEGLTLLRVR